MSFVLGVVLFALAIGVSIALHEAGHMYSAKAFGMKVRRYFIGFGPTVWSRRRGETEYGLKAIPAGGFCDIAGMNTLDELPDPADRRRAFFRFPTWKRVVVLSAGSVTHFVLGIVVVYAMAISTGLPNTNPVPAVVGQVTECINSAQDGPCPPQATTPAEAANLQPGDRILAVAGNPVADFRELNKLVQARSGPTLFVVERNGQRLTTTVDIAQLQVPARQGAGTRTVGVIGVAAPPQPSTLDYAPAEAVGQTFAFIGLMFERTWEGILSLPQKIEPLLDRIAGKQRPQTPMSVVGVSILGGDAVDMGAWWFFLYLLAALNLFVGVLNLLPLLPFDGGHIAVNLYERVRNLLRRLVGRGDGPPVDYTKLLPVTYALFIVIVGFGALVVIADIVNPIRLNP